MSKFEKRSEDSKTVCPECGSELIVEIGSCPICGSDIPLKSEHEINKTESSVREKMTLLYNLIFWAEELKIDTKKGYELLSEAWDRLTVGDLEGSEKFLDDAIEDIFYPTVKVLKDDVRKKSAEIEEVSLSKEDISELRSLVDKAVNSMKDDDRDEALSLLIEYKMRLDGYQD